MTSNRPEQQSTFDFREGTEVSRVALEPQRGQSASAVVRTTALSEPSEKLMEQIVESRNMERAWKNVKANRGAPGPDGITLEEFEATFRDQWPIVRQHLLEGTYEPSPARRKSIPKPDGSERHLGIPNVQDRVIQQAILQILTPIFDPGFSDSSFGFRPKRSAHGAAQQVQRHIRAGYRECVDMDRHGRHGFGSELTWGVIKAEPSRGDSTGAAGRSSSTEFNMTCCSCEWLGRSATSGCCV